jgi:hypothetical protein
LTEAEKANLAKDFLNARKMAPSRPHPSSPQHGGMGQMLMGGMGMYQHSIENNGLLMRLL